MSRTALLVALVALAGCRWSFFSSGAFSGSDYSPGGPSQLAIERGLTLPTRWHVPPWEPAAPETVWSLAEGWRPITFAARRDRCYAIRLEFPGSSDSEHGPFSHAARLRGDLEPVLREPGGAVVARRDPSENAVALCNWAGHETLTFDVEGVAGALGTARVRVQPFARALDENEQRERALRDVRLGASVLVERERYAPRRIRATRTLTAFTPLELGEIAPMHCDAVTVQLAPGTVVSPDAAAANTPLRYQVAGGNPSERLDVLEVAGAALVAGEVCNPTADPITATVVLAPGATPPAIDVTLEAFTRPFDTVITRHPFLGGGFAPDPTEGFAPLGPPVARPLAAFAPVPFTIASGRCALVAITAAPGTRIDRRATAYTHYLVYLDPRARQSYLAQGVTDDGRVVPRALCNASLDAMKVTLELRARAGKPAGRGDVMVQVLDRQGTHDELAP